MGACALSCNDTNNEKELRFKLIRADSHSTLHSANFVQQMNYSDEEIFEHCGFQSSEESLKNIKII